MSQHATFSSEAHSDFENQNPSVSHADSVSITVRKLIWVYFWLLIFEGAIRKWILPPLAAPLLIIRDPVVLLIFGYLLSVRRFPMHWIVVVNFILAILMFVAGLIHMSLTGENNIFVCLYGLRANFLHVPLILIMGSFLTQKDVEHFGKWFLILAIPMSILMTMQFLASPGSWLNIGIGGDTQIAATMGKIRPPGTFSFISGPIFFFTLVAGFFIFSQLKQKLYPWWVILGGGSALLLALAVSGSRTALANVVLIAATLPICWLMQPVSFLRSLRLIFLMAFVGGIAFCFPAFREGIEVFSARIAEAQTLEGGFLGFLQRFSNDMLEPILLIPENPLFGHGLGIGTNVGAVLLTGGRDFLLAEEEYGRVLLESGPILGGAYLLFRLAIALWLAVQCARAVQQRHFLPLFLFVAVAINLIRGQWGQPTTAGFAVFAAGLCLAACRRDLTPEPAEEFENHQAQKDPS
jgi:hypothetical protein